MDWYVGTEWSLTKKGLYKKVIRLSFTKLEKPQLTSVVCIKVSNVGNLNGRPSKYLTAEEGSGEQMIKLGTALTPVDYYLELIVQQMILGETAVCTINTTKQTESITCELTLEKIIGGKEIQKLTVGEMFDLALLYKQNGVAMFKQYPKFAHDYFARAAKCLISYKPFDNLTKKSDGADASDMQALFVQVQTNLAACLLNVRRYEDVIYQTNFVDNMENPSEKSVYRRALAYYNIKEYEKAQKTIERVPNYEMKREFAKLRDNISASWKNSNVNYKQVVQRMFN